MKMVMGNTGEQIYNAEKVAKFFGVSVKTARIWCEEGKIPAFKIGKEWKIRVLDLQKLIDQKVRSNQRKDPQKGLF